MRTVRIQKEAPAGLRVALASRRRRPAGRCVTPRSCGVNRLAILWGWTDAKCSPAPTVVYAERGTIAKPLPSTEVKAGSCIVERQLRVRPVGGRKSGQRTHADDPVPKGCPRGLGEETTCRSYSGSCSSVRGRFPHPRLRAGLALLVLFVFLSAPPLAGQDPQPEPEQPDTFPVAPSVWCLVVDSKDEQPEPQGEEEDPGCDAGVAAALYRFQREPRASVVGALGTWSLGAGLGWTFHRSEAGTAYGVAGGIMVPWDGEGIHVNRWGWALGATVSFGRATN